MSFWSLKQSNLTPSIFKDDNRMESYIIDVDRDLQNLYRMASPFYQFGTGVNYSVMTYTSTNWVWHNTIGGWSMTNDLLYAGSGATYMGLQPGTGIWMGNAAFGSAVFSVDPNGQMVAHAGDIGGWYIGATTLSSTNLVFDSGNELVRTTDFASGPLGSGWQIDNNLAEFNNIRARGKITTAVFEKDVISSIGGNLLIANSAVLTADMSAADDSELAYSSDTVFATNDILRIKDSSNDEWFTITGSSSAYSLTVTRDEGSSYTADNNPAWKKGTAVISYGSSTCGMIFLTASETNAPHIDVITHTGTPWTSPTTKVRIGNLNGFLGYSSDEYGIAIGESTKYLKYDSTDGLRVRGNILADTGTLTTLSILGTLSVETSGVIKSGQTAYNTGDGWWLEYNSGTPRFSIGNAPTVDSNTKLLLHCDGTDGSTTFTDDGDTGHTVTANGNAQVDTAQSVFGGASALFDGTGDYLSIADHDDWDFDSGDFTIDFRVRFDALPTDGNNMCFIGQWVDGSNHWDFMIYNNSGTYNWALRAEEAGESIDINFEPTCTVATDTWYHIAVVRSGNTFYVFQDGTSLGTTTDSDDFPALAAALEIGRRGDASHELDGWMDEIRVTKGEAIWTSNFTKPSSAYSTGTYMTWNGTDLTIRGTLNADDITAGTVDAERLVNAPGYKLGAICTTASQPVGINSLKASRYEAAVTATIDRVIIQLEQCNNGDNFVVGIYSDSSGTPDALLAQTAEQTVANSGYGFYSIALEDSVDLTVGTTYWLAVHAGGSGGFDVGQASANGAATFGKYKDTAYSSTMPSTWPGTTGNYHALAIAAL